MRLNWRSAIPWSMVMIRAALGPALAATAIRFSRAEFWLGAMVATGFVLDIYDGILARRWGTATSRLRLSDSLADTVFYLGVLAAVIIRHPNALRERWVLLAVLLSLEVVRWIFDWFKYGRMSSYHTYASKFWAILMAAASMALLGFDQQNWILTSAFACGILCDLEGLAISLILPVWTHDVKNLLRAIEIRNELLAAK